MRYQFYTADVFTDQPFAGNPLAVFPEAEGLSPEQMGRVAREFNYPETVFVFPPQEPAHTCRLRIFTPGIELPFAGHPTLGAAYILASIGRIPLSGAVTPAIFEEGVGPVPVSIRAEQGRPVSAQLTAAQAPEFGPPPPPLERMAALLSLDVSELRNDDLTPQALSCGVPFLYIPLHNRQALGRIRLNRQVWAEAFAGYWAPHIYVFTPDPELPGSDLRARMFAPAMDIEEDPATGAAVTALGAYLGLRHPAADGTLQWRVEQGFEMGRPSLLEVEADKVNDQIAALRVSGAAVLVSEGMMEIPKA